MKLELRTLFTLLLESPYKDPHKKFSLNLHPVQKIPLATAKVKKNVLFLDLLWTSNLLSLSLSFFHSKMGCFLTPRVLSKN